MLKLISLVSFIGYYWVTSYKSDFLTERMPTLIAKVTIASFQVFDTKWAKVFKPVFYTLKYLPW